MTGDDHVRLYEDGTRESLPTIISMRVCSENPEEDGRLEAELQDRNKRVEAMLDAKGFGIDGDEPGGVQMQRFAAMQEPDG